MSYGAPSPSAFFLSANHTRLADQDLALLPTLSCGLSASIMNPFFSSSPGSYSSSPLSRASIADLLYSNSKARNISPLQSPRSRAVSSPRPCFGLGLDVRPRPVKENRGFTQSNAPASGDINRVPLERKRPAKLAIPESARLASLGKAKQFVLPEQNAAEDSHSHEEAFFAVSSKRGRKDRMEDAYTASTHFQGNPKQAFFGVFDGHGGKHAADFAASNLSRHFSVAMQNEKEGQVLLEGAMYTGYMTTDAEFLDKRLGSGACAVSAFVKEGEMVVANAGDCKAVLCRAGKAESLSVIHRASNEAEQQRVEDLGGFVDCINGVWRIQNTLAVTRGFGDAPLKKWVSAEPEVKKIDIAHDCEFLILASDGLWDQMTDQEAVDCARKVLDEGGLLSNCRNVNNMKEVTSKELTNHHLASFLIAQNKDKLQLSCMANAHLLTAQNRKDSMPSAKTNACDKLIRTACQRGNQDDITVMIVLLQDFMVA